MAAVLRAGLVLLTMGAVPGQSAARPCDLDDLDALAALLGEWAGRDAADVPDAHVLRLLAVEAGCEWSLGDDDAELQFARLAGRVPEGAAAERGTAPEARPPWWRSLLPRVELRWALWSMDGRAGPAVSYRRGSAIEVWFLWTMGAVSW